MTVTGHSYTATRVRGLAEWNPNPSTWLVLDQVQQVLVEYQTYLPLTARQVFYRLVGAHGYDKTEKAYKRLLEYLNRARRAGIIPWRALRDDGFTSTGGGGWDSPQDVIDATIRTARNYKRNHQDGQPYFHEVWVEAAGMMPQVAGMIRDWSIPVYSSGGFNSVTAKYETARRIRNRLEAEERPTAVLHIGDYDPSGVAVIDSLADDLQAFLADMGAGAGAVFTRVAVTPDQIDTYGLPGSPAKATDNRAGFTDLATQAEALAPPQLEAEVQRAVLARFDLNIFEDLLVTEAEERAELVDVLEGIEL